MAAAGSGWGERVPDPGQLPAPSGRQVQVWWARVAVGHLAGSVRETLAADLDPATLTRLDRFHRVADRDRGLAAHALLRRLLAAVAGGPPSRLVLRTRCAGCGKTDHGKPYLDVGTALPPVEVNLSHSAEVVCVALTAPGIQVGVDVEGRRPVNWAVMRRAVFADQEWAGTEQGADPARRRMDAWARKEAAVKSSGHGLSLPLRAVLVENAPWGGWTASLPSQAGSAVGWDLDLDRDVAAAVAVHRDSQPPPPDRPTVHRVNLSERS
jgi:4'-phosphopantetheinyl transferase